MKSLTRLLFTILCACTALSLTVLAGPERLPSGKEMKEIAPAPAPECNWTGFYVGLNGGYTWSDNDNVSTDSRDQFGNPALGGGPAFGVASAELATFDLPNSNDGFIGGGQVGANLEIHRFVIGLEADLQAVLGNDNNSTRQDSSLAPVGFAGSPIVQEARVERDINSFGTVRGRLGYAVTPCLLVYATGGLAYGEISARTDIQQTVLNAPLIPFTYTSHGRFDDNLKAGWTAGGGLEWLFMRHWSVKAEYLYYDLGRVSYGLSNLSNFNTSGTLFTTARPTSSTDFNGHIVRGGLNFHF